MDMAVLNKTLLVTHQEVEDWDQRHHLFALLASDSAHLEHLMSSCRGSTLGMLAALLGLGLRTRPDIAGLVLATREKRAIGRRGRQVVMGILHDGTSSVLIADPSTDVVVFTPRLPADCGDHEEMLASALRLLDRRKLPRQAVRTLAATG